MIQGIIDQANPRMDKAVDHLQDSLRQIRTGRASTALIDGVTLEQYGQMVPLKTVATLSVPDAHTIAISPWDKSLIPVIEKAIRETQSLGLNPSNDGAIIRLNLPPMTTERRTELTKQVGEQIEACHVALRNIRHDVLNEARKAEQAKSASQDDLKFAENELNKRIDDYRRKLDDIKAAKVKEIMEV
ncbi:MAG TPA: ribosome recycling factor [Candidatus Saccharimonadales bacterium]|nr:ribosome recycling factor [Candidatus Saccharimonadales bacterium]